MLSTSMSNTTKMPSGALIPVPSAPNPEVNVRELERSTDMTLSALTPWCSILTPSSAEAGDQETATESTSTALVLWQPHAVNRPLEIDDLEAEPFPFTKLPAELRNRIYRYVLKASRPIHSYWFRKHTDPNFAAILQVSRLINIEATVILYRENTIRFMMRTLKVPFQDAYPSSIIDIPRRFIPLLKHIAISSPRVLVAPDSERKWCIEMCKMSYVISLLASAAPNLESITHLTLFNEVAATKVYDDMYGLRTVMYGRIARHQSLKEFVVVYGQADEENSRVLVLEPQVFPGHEHVQLVVDKTLRDLRTVITRGTFPITIKVPFMMTRGHADDIRRRAGITWNTPRHTAYNR